MASIVNYTGDGTTDTFNLTFDYIDANNVAVLVNDVAASFTFLTDTSVQLSSAPASGAAIVIKRTTPITALVDFADGSTLFETDLDLSAKQSRFLSEEARDRADDSLTQITANKANINTVAGIASDVTSVSGINTDVTSVAGITSDVTAVAGKATEVGIVSGKVAEVKTVADDLNNGSFIAGTEYDFGSIATASSGSTGSPDGFIVSVYNKLPEITNVANNISALQTVNSVSADTTTVAGIASDVTTVSGISANVTAVVGNATNINAVNANASNINAVAADATDIGTVATNIANVNTAASNMSAINTVNSNASNINAVAADASDIGTVATNITNVNAVGGISANVTTVAGISSDVTAVAADATDIGAVAAIATEIGNVNGISANVTTVAGNTSNINTVAGNNADITTVAGISSDVTTVAGDATDIGTLAAISSDVTSLANALGAATTFTVTVAQSGGINVFYIDGAANPTLTFDRGNTYIFDLSDSSVSGHPLAFKDSSGNSYSVGVTSTGTPGQSGAQVQIDVAQNAPSSLRYYCTVHGNGMGNTITVVNSNLATVASNITSVNNVSSNLTNINSVNSNSANINAVAGDATDIGTVATDIANVNSVATNIANVNSVGGSIANVNTVATNLSSVNSFGEKYRIGSSDPASSNDEGDLFYNTTSDTLKVYNGSTWEAGVTAGSGFMPLSGGTFTGTINVTTVDWGDWTITESGGSLYFATGGTNKMKLDASGNLDVAGSVNANATIT